MSIRDAFADSGCSIAEQTYGIAQQKAIAGASLEAEQLYRQIGQGDSPAALRSLAENDLGALAAAAGNMQAAQQHFTRALQFDPACEAAQRNLGLIARSLEAAAGRNEAAAAAGTFAATGELRTPSHATRVAILSLLFNWPSTGGGTVHTAESAEFLQRAGFDVRHIYAQYANWEVGKVTHPLDVPAEALQFEPATWNAAEIQRQFREAVDQFSPDYVIITDSWNFKPLLAEAVEGYRYFIRLAALECLCPLNNVRLLVDSQGQVSACPRHQLATPSICRTCVEQHVHHSGVLHQAERALSGHGTPEYDERLKRAFAQAEGILAVNPLIAAMVSPYAKAVHVVPSGFDPQRFPSSWSAEATHAPKTRMTIFFAGMVEEYMKGFHVLQAACAKLWQKRQDFELLVTADAPGPADPMTRYIGWLSQDDLPRHMRQADFLAFPTIAEEALGRSAVEAMGVGRPVIASRIGGLQFTVTDGLTGLLFEPGNADDLACKIETLLDDPALCERMGKAARKRFEEEFTWQAIIDKHYRPLLKPVEPSAPTRPAQASAAAASSNGRRYDRLIEETGEFFGLARGEIERMFHTYRSIRDAQKKSINPSNQSAVLSLEEGFVVCLLLSLTRPATLVVVDSDTEIARRFVELKSFIGLESPVVVFDASTGASSDFSEDSFKPPVDIAEPEDAKRLSPPTGRFRADVLDRYRTGFIWLGVASELLSREIAKETAGHFGRWVLASPGTSRFASEADGTARRHMLAAVSNIDGHGVGQKTDTYRLATFESAGKLTLLAPGYIGVAAPPSRPEQTARRTAEPTPTIAVPQ
ncbi:MAG TPA: glycosyltransferase family 4 protein [Planctomycetaceae bacterium]|nr:glycosyltransferase family 4 protein [Planctomycetaceae bacterium]